MTKNMPRKIRGNFDGIANKFDRNIYGTSKGRLRHQLLLHHLSEYIDNGAVDVIVNGANGANNGANSSTSNKQIITQQSDITPQATSQLKQKLNILDVGGGTGIMAKEFAANGHKVHLIDVSEDTLEIARQRLLEYSDASIQHTSLSHFAELYTGQGYDLILCHALLEWLDDPLTAVQELSALLAPKGVLSLSFFNHDAKVFNNLLYGNFDYVQQGLPARNTVRLNPHNAQKPAEVLEYIQQHTHLTILSSNGIRCIHDYMLDKSRIEPQYDSLFTLELQYGALAPYKYLGKYFHVMLQS